MRYFLQENSFIASWSGPFFFLANLHWFNLSLIDADFYLRISAGNICDYLRELFFYESFLADFRWSYAQIDIDLCGVSLFNYDRENRCKNYENGNASRYLLASAMDENLISSGWDEILFAEFLGLCWVDFTASSIASISAERFINSTFILALAIKIL